MAHDVYDHTSILKMMEWRWSLRPLSVRDSGAKNLAEALDFSHPNVAAPVFNVPTGPFGGLCGPVAQAEVGFLLAFSAQFGFPSPF